MARGRPRASGASLTRSTPAKRTLSPATPLRQSKRTKSESTTPRGARSTPKKSIYFEQSQSEAESEVAEEREESGYEDEDASAVDATSESGEEEYVSSEDEKPRRRKSKGLVKAVPIAAPISTQNELWREGVRVDVEPGQKVYIELPKARTAGKISYKDTTIHPNTLLFLADLKANNERPWLKMHDADFRQSEKDWKSYVEKLSDKLIEVDAAIPELPVKDIIFRIYRDVRFSSDPTPYKPHFSVAWSRTGRKGPFACYYLQISKSNSFFGGGLWMPNAGQLASLRRAIDRKPREFKEVLKNNGIRTSFLGGVSTDPKKLVKAFCAANKENALKKKPKDYDADHPEIDLLRLKNFILGCKLKDEDITAKDSIERVGNLMRHLEPWVTFLNSIVMPDEPSGDEEDDEDDEQDETGIDESDAASDDGTDDLEEEFDGEQIDLDESEDPEPE